MNSITVKGIENVLKDNDDFLAFLRNGVKCGNIVRKAYIKAINGYMNLLVKTANRVPEVMFYRVNYINKYFGVDIVYDYEKYLLNSDDDKINWPVIRFIFNNDEVFSKFMNYEDNKKFFGNVDIEVYLNVMNNILEYFKKYKLEISSLEKSRYDEIMAKYSLKLRKKHDLPGKKFKVKLDESFKKKVLENIDSDEAPFYIARSIYIKLCKMLRFNFNVIIQNINSDPENFKKIYLKDPFEVNERNNEIVCSTWAIIYCTLLNENGIEARVVGDAHKYVIFDVDGTLIRADATKSVVDELNLNMNDITRVQMGLKTKGFVCLEPYKNIDNDIVKVDCLNGDYLIELDEAYERINNEYMTVKRLDEEAFKYKELLVKLDAIYRNNNTNNLEAMRFVGCIIEYLKNVGLYDLGYSYIATKDGERYFCNLILFFKNNSNYHYFLLNKNNLRKVTLDNIRYNIEGKKAKVLGKNHPIPGIN